MFNHEQVMDDREKYISTWAIYYKESGNMTFDLDHYFFTFYYNIDTKNYIKIMHWC